MAIKSVTATSRTTQTPSVSTSARDTDFTIKLLDVHPPSADWPRIGLDQRHRPWPAGARQTPIGRPADHQHGGLAAGVVEVLVDSGTSRDNITRCAQTAGWAVTVQEAPGGDFRLVLRKG